MFFESQREQNACAYAALYDTQNRTVILDDDDLLDLARPLEKLNEAWRAVSLPSTIFGQLNSRSLFLPHPKRACLANRTASAETRVSSPSGSASTRA